MRTESALPEVTLAAGTRSPRPERPVESDKLDESAAITDSKRSNGLQHKGINNDTKEIDRIIIEYSILRICWNRFDVKGASQQVLIQGGFRPSYSRIREALRGSGDTSI